MQKIMQYTRYATVVLCLFQGYSTCHFLPASGVISHHCSGNPRHDSKARDSTGRRIQGWAFRIVTSHYPDYWDTFSDVAGRSDHRARHRQRHLVNNHGRNRGAFAGSADAGLARRLSQCRRGSRYRSVQSDSVVLVLMILFLFLVIAGVITITQGVRKISVQYAKRVVGRKMYGGQSTVHAVESELRRRDADHFRMGHSVISQHDHQSVCLKNSPTASKIAKRTQFRLGRITLDCWR